MPKIDSELLSASVLTWKSSTSVTVTLNPDDVAVNFSTLWDVVHWPVESPGTRRANDRAGPASADSASASAKQATGIHPGRIGPFEAGLLTGTPYRSIIYKPIYRTIWGFPGTKQAQSDGFTNFLP